MRNTRKRPRAEVPGFYGLGSIILGVSLTLMLGLIDYLTGPELSFSIFYLLPISLATWLINRRSGIGLSLISAVLWLVADLGAGHIYAHPLVPYWNVSVRLGFFLIITYVLARLRASVQWQEELH